MRSNDPAAAGLALLGREIQKSVEAYFAPLAAAVKYVRRTGAAVHVSGQAPRETDRTRLEEHERRDAA